MEWSGWRSGSAASAWDLGRGPEGARYSMPGIVGATGRGQNGRVGEMAGG